jgi:citrate synthase
LRALDRIFILHADHEQNASTSTVRLCASSGTNPFAATPPASRVCGAWRTAARTRPASTCWAKIRPGRRRQDRRLHKQVKDKNSGIKLMGFGHRVYTTIRARN